MIEVTIKSSSGRERSTIVIEAVEEHDDGTTDCIAKFSVMESGSLTTRRRPLWGFQTGKYNNLGLLLLALQSLTEEELKREVGSSDMEREERRAGLALPREATDSVGNYRPAFRSGQSVELVDNSGGQENGEEDCKR